MLWTQFDIVKQTFWKTLNTVLYVTLRYTQSKLTALLFKVGNTAIVMPHSFTDAYTVIMSENTYILFVHLVIFSFINYVCLHCIYIVFYK